MSFDADAGKKLWGVFINILLVIISGVLASLVFPPYGWWWCGWFAMVPLFVALRRTKEVRASSWLMLLFGMVFFANTLTWLYQIFQQGVLGIYILVTLPWLLFAVAYRVTGQRYPGIWAVLLAAILWVGAEWVRCEGWYFNFSWAQMGFGFINVESLTGMYKYIGVFGYTFLIILVNAALAEIILASKNMTKRVKIWTYIITFFIIGCLIVTIMIIEKVHSANDFFKDVFENKTKHVWRYPTALIVQDETSDLQKMEQLTNNLKEKDKQQIIVWPELAINRYPLTEEGYAMDNISRIARDTQSVLVLGCKEKAPADAKVDWLRRRAMMSVEGELFYNSALIVGPDGEVIGAYHKTHPIQFFSDGVPGGKYPTFPSPVGRLGVAICYDFDYASTNVNLVKNGAEVLVVPTYDSMGWTALQHTQHSQMAQCRAAEVGRWVLRSTSSGISQIIQPDGSLKNSIPNGESSSMTGHFEKCTEMTPYMRGPYLLPYICFGIGTLWGIWLLWLMFGDWKRRKILPDNVETQNLASGGNVKTHGRASLPGTEMQTNETQNIASLPGIETPENVSEENNN